MKNLRHERNAGLTLVEMLVVMGICMALAALMVPFLFRGRDEARLVVCKNNLKNIGGAFHVIMPLQQGYFTNSFYDIAQLGSQEWWVGLSDASAQAGPLMQQPLASSLQCPSERGYVKVVCASNGRVVRDSRASYVYNVEMPIIAKNVSRVRDPVNRVLFYDGDPALLVGIWKHAPDWAEKTIVVRHRGRANFLLLDGHVETYGEFGAHMMHGCDMFATPEDIPTGPLTPAPEFDGLSNWVLWASSVDIHQENNNVRNQGNYLQCTIRISGTENSPVDLNTVHLLGVVGNPFKTPVPAVPPMRYVTHEDGGLVCQLKFDRQLVYDQLATGGHLGEEVPLKVVGQLENDRPFEGVDPSCYFDTPN